MATIYHRVESPTQTNEDARRQEQRGEMWGYPARGSDQPKVKAYVGKLPAAKRGIEFSTDISPDSHCPPGLAYWSGPRPGVIVKEGRATIKVTVTRNAQS